MNEDLLKSIRPMTKSLKHRGPDGYGIWSDPSSGIALGHDRLSIMDLSHSGAQPMVSVCNRYVLVFNGEIYNHLLIREELENSGMYSDWRGRSDTETLLAAIAALGIRATLEKLNGMFAFALWDRQTCSLTLARDRIGEKPIYYGLFNDSLIFASELKAFYVIPNWSTEIDRQSLALFMRYNHIPSPRTIFKGIHKLPAAHYIVVPSSKSDAVPRCYWDLNSVVLKGRQNTFHSYEDALCELDFVLRDAVGSRMISDVPLGAFLSGGYDSTIVVAYMQALSEKPIETFTIGNFCDDINEAKHASLVARHLGTEHTELYVSDKDALDIIPRLPIIYDEPFADSSQIPTYLVSQLAKRRVSVVLSGDGGDELFGGYNRHVIGGLLWRRVNQLPYFIRVLLAKTLGFVSVCGLYDFLQRVPILSNIPGLELKLKKVFEALGSSSQAEFYDRIRRHWAVDNLVLSNTVVNFSSSRGQIAGLDISEMMMYWDMKTYLSDDILTKLDRASMAVSLESRAPFLDHRLVEFSWRLPLHYKIRERKGKWILRELLHKYVPRELMDRPKRGFGIPLAQWLRGPLRGWAEDLLDESLLRKQGFLNASIVRKRWAQLQRFQAPCEHEIWCVLMFQSWLETYESRERFAAYA